MLSWSDGSCLPPPQCKPRGHFLCLQSVSVCVCVYTHVPARPPMTEWYLAGSGRNQKPLTVGCWGEEGWGALPGGEPTFCCLHFRFFPVSFLNLSVICISCDLFLIVVAMSVYALCLKKLVILHKADSLLSPPAPAAPIPHRPGFQLQAESYRTVWSVTLDIFIMKKMNRAYHEED